MGLPAISTLTSQKERVLVFFLFSLEPRPAASFNFYHLLAGPLSKVILGIRASIYEFGGQGDIQSLTSSPVVTLSEIFVQEVLVWRKCDS